MNECERCGISEEKVRLFDAITSKGMIKICRACAEREKYPLITKPTTEQLKDAEKGKKNFYQRAEKKIAQGYEKPKENVTLRDIVEKNFQKRIPEVHKPREDLIDNFHWVIMRARRARKVTQEQMAREIGEAEAAIKMAERGVLPEDASKLISKIQSYLGITLFRNQNKDFSKRLNRESEEVPEFERLEEDIEKFEKEKRKPEELEFDPLTLNTLTISDLQEMKKKKREEFEISCDDADDSEKDLSDDDIRGFAWGRKPKNF